MRVEPAVKRLGWRQCWRGCDETDARFDLAGHGADDMCTGIDGLSLQRALGRLPRDGSAYVFANR